MKWVSRHKFLCLFLAAAVVFLAWSRYDRQFTPRRWADTPISRRGKLVDSLLEQYGGLTGMTRAEVEALLGPDTDGEQMEERLLPDGDSKLRFLLVYPAGGRFGAIFPEYLYIYLQDGLVTEAKLVAD